MSGIAGERFAVVTARPRNLALPQERHERRDVVEEAIDPAGNDVLERGRGAAIRHVRQLDSGDRA